MKTPTVNRASKVVVLGKWLQTDSAQVVFGAGIGIIVALTGLTLLSLSRTAEGLFLFVAGFLLYVRWRAFQ